MVFIIYCSVCQVYLVWCLLKRYGVEPPGLIKLEKEIEQEETLSAPSPSPSPSSKSSGKKSTGNLLDDAVSNIHQASYQYLLLLNFKTHSIQSPVSPLPIPMLLKFLLESMRKFIVLQFISRFKTEPLILFKVQYHLILLSSTLNFRIISAAPENCLWKHLSLDTTGSCSLVHWEEIWRHGILRTVKEGKGKTQWRR